MIHVQIEGPLESEQSKRPLLVPTTLPTLTEFIREIEEALQSEATHVYIDTSFLIWLTMLGKTARSEFISWMDKIGRTRFHVPVWASHEFLRHHTKKLIEESLTKAANKLTDLADTSYSYLRPFLDEPLGGDPRRPEKVRSEAREILTQVKILAQRVSRWSGQHYSEHFIEVANLINEIGLRNAVIFDSMSEIDIQEKNRYSGRIPPGFQDRRKKEQFDQEEDGEAVVGSNRFGDLMLWREILHHAKADSVQTILILSNDRKNDWRMGGPGEIVMDQDLLAERRDWPPVPTAHPLLSFEASKVANVTRVFLIDSLYLAAFLRKTGAACENFADAAIAVELPQAKGFAKRVRKERARSMYAAKQSEASPLGDIDAQYDDGPNTSDADLALKLSFATSRKPGKAAVEALLAAALRDNFAGRSLEDFLTPAFVQDASTGDLVRLARELHVRALAGEALGESHSVDLVNLLPNLPHKAATCLYLGLLAAIYFDEENGVRLPPANLILWQVLKHQDKSFARPGIAVVRERILKADRQPLYVPSPEKPTLLVEILTQTESLQVHAPLVGLRMDGIELVTQAQGDSDLSFASRFENRSPLIVREIVEVACAVFGIPREQIGEDSSLDREVGYESPTGFQTPSEVYRSKE
jgi:hypothetical protein